VAVVAEPAAVTIEQGRIISVSTEAALCEAALLSGPASTTSALEEPQVPSLVVAMPGAL
jgi:hypothetical protein